MTCICKYIEKIWQNLYEMINRIGVDASEEDLNFYSVEFWVFYKEDAIRHYIILNLNVIIVFQIQLKWHGSGSWENDERCLKQSQWGGHILSAYSSSGA